MLYFACSIANKLVKLLSLSIHPFHTVWVNPEAIICLVKVKSIRFEGGWMFVYSIMFLLVLKT